MDNADALVCLGVLWLGCTVCFTVRGPPRRVRAVFVALTRGLATAALVASDIQGGPVVQAVISMLVAVGEPQAAAVHTEPAPETRVSGAAGEG